MKKRLIFIDPPGNQKGINVGLAYLSAVLSVKNVDHKIVDLNNFCLNDSELFKVIEGYLPDLVGFSVKTATYHSTIELVKKLKTNYPHIVYFAGGPHITLFYNEFFNEIDSVDFGLIGEAEITVSNLCDCDFEYKNRSGVVYKEGREIKCKPAAIPQNLDTLPFPSFDKYHNIKFKNFSYPLVTSRGCPYGCTYCSVKYISGSKWRKRSPLHVLEELKNCKKKYEITSFEIIDDTFTQKVDRAIALCDLLIKENIRLPWSCPNGIRADRMNLELGVRMKKSGCHTVIFGVESADPEIFKSINKGEQLSDVVKAIKITKQAGLKVGGYFIIGLPGDSLEKTKKSLKFIKAAGLDWAHFNILSPYPMTEIWNTIKKEGRFFEDYKVGRHFLKPNPIFEINGFSREQMIEAYLYVHTCQDLFSLIVPPEGSLKERITEAVGYIWKYDKWKIVRYRSWKKFFLVVSSKIINKLRNFFK